MAIKPGIIFSRFIQKVKDLQNILKEKIIH